MSRKFYEMPFSRSIQETKAKYKAGQHSPRRHRKLNII